MVEVVLIEDLPVDQAVLVQHVTLLGESVQHPGGPLAKLSGPLGVHPVAHSDDGGERIELISVSFAIICNLCKKCTS